MISIGDSDINSDSDGEEQLSSLQWCLWQCMALTYYLPLLKYKKNIELTNRIYSDEY